MVQNLIHIKKSAATPLTFTYYTQNQLNVQILSGKMARRSCHAVKILLWYLIPIANSGGKMAKNEPSLI